MIKGEERTHPVADGPSEKAQHPDANVALVVDVDHARVLPPARRAGLKQCLRQEGAVRNLHGALLWSGHVLRARRHCVRCCARCMGSSARPTRWDQVPHLLWGTLQTHLLGEEVEYAPPEQDGVLQIRPMRHCDAGGRQRCARAV